MDELIRHLQNIYAMDWPTLAVISSLCVATAFAIREYLAHSILALLALPVLFAASVGMQYLLIVGEVYIPNKLEQWLMWTVIASICGNMIGIAIVAAVGRIKDRTVPVHSSVRAARTRHGMR
jgi:hypothetical protein